MEAYTPHVKQPMRLYCDSGDLNPGLCNNLEDREGHVTFTTGAAHADGRRGQHVLRGNFPSIKNKFGGKTIEVTLRD